MNGVKQGLKRIPIHFFGFGIPVGLAVYFFGWSGLFVLTAWRGCEEYHDVHENRDTVGKAIIDFVSQISGPVVAGLLR
jgi:hypothetical protein